MRRIVRLEKPARLGKAARLEKAAVDEFIYDLVRAAGWCLFGLGCLVFVLGLFFGCALLIAWNHVWGSILSVVGLIVVISVLFAWQNRSYH
jgi:hypothetical protein